MARVIILGSSGAVSNAQHDYSHFLLLGEKDRPVLVDAGSNPLDKIRALGIDDSQLEDIILTHFHSDHVAGVPNMLMHMWQMGRKAPIRFYWHPALPRPHGRHDGHVRLGILARFLPRDVFADWHAGRHAALRESRFRHPRLSLRAFHPHIGMRITNKHNGKVLAYSCDTEPCENAVKIGKDADIFIHEAGGPPPGHSTGRMAGEAAAAAGAKELRPHPLPGLESRPGHAGARSRRSLRRTRPSLPRFRRIRVLARRSLHQRQSIIQRGHRQNANARRERASTVVAALVCATLGFASRLRGVDA